MGLRLDQLSSTDRTILRICSAVGFGLFVGLTITGIWQLLRHEPTATWSDFAVGSPDRPDPPRSEGMSDIHGALGDLTAMFMLFIAVWVSYRVLQRTSWAAVAALGITFVGLLSGGTIRFNATIRDAVTDTTTAGYRQIFGGDVDLMITDSLDLSMGPARAWTIVHLVALPLVVMLPWLAVRRARRRAAAAPTTGPSWIDQLNRKEP